MYVSVYLCIFLSTKFLWSLCLNAQAYNCLIQFYNVQSVYTGQGPVTVSVYTQPLAQHSQEYCHKLWSNWFLAVILATSPGPGLVGQLYGSSYVKGSVPGMLTRQLYSPVYSTCVGTAATDTAPEEAPQLVSPKNNTNHLLTR